MTTQHCAGCDCDREQPEPPVSAEALLVDALELLWDADSWFQATGMVSPSWNQHGQSVRGVCEGGNDPYTVPTILALNAQGFPVPIGDSHPGYDDGARKWTVRGAIISNAAAWHYGGPLPWHPQLTASTLGAIRAVEESIRPLSGVRYGIDAWNNHHAVSHNMVRSLLKRAIKLAGK